VFIENTYLYPMLVNAEDLYLLEASKLIVIECIFFGN